MTSHGAVGRQRSGSRRSYASELDPQQLEVVTTGDGAVLVLAGAGSGKTRAVTYRVAYLIEQGVAPDSILLLTFTNKAAREMLGRVAELVGTEAAGIWGGTYHSVANRILRRHAGLLGFKPNFSILDRDDSRQLVQRAISELGLSSAGGGFPTAGVLLGLFSYLANTEWTLEQLLERRLPFFSDSLPDVQRVLTGYGELKRQANAVDFDDLLVMLLELLQEHEAVRLSYAERFRYVLVDEYQDTNRIQALIVDRLSERHANLMVVGDDAQSIYSFRGADFSNILEFPKRYPEARCLKLETNYRSSPEVVELANRVIAENRHQFAKTLVAVRPPGTPPRLVTPADLAREAVFVAERVGELWHDGQALAEVAVLYRSHFQSLDLQMELQRRGIPYEVRSGLRLFDAAHMRDVLAQLRLVDNPSDSVSWTRVLKLLPGVGDRTAVKLLERLGSAAGASRLDALVAGLADAVVPRRARGPFAKLKATLAELAADEIRQNPSESIRAVLRSEYVRSLYARFEDAERRLEELDQLASFAESFESTEAFLSELSLASQSEAESSSLSEGTSRLVLTTVHQAKGLEWQSVFVIGLTDGRFPSARSVREAGDEEERRLFYVAVTRARDELYLVYPTLNRDENRHWVLSEPSRFLVGLGDDVLQPLRLGEEAFEYADDDDNRVWDDAD